MESIKLNDILRLEKLDNVKIRLNLSNNLWNAINLYHEDPNFLRVGNFHNSINKKWFKVNEIVIGLAQIKQDDWLLFDISRILIDNDKLFDGVTKAEIDTFYKTEKLAAYEKYFGRLIVKFHKKNAFVTLKGDKIDNFLVKEILPGALDHDQFPGYDKVNISWHDLKRVVEKDTWKAVLQNQKGVYLISDISNGKKYVGSAYGENMILGRWMAYVKTGHGGNIGLKDLKFDHIKEHFRYSILDIFKATINDKVIIERESWWKKVLQTREFGYNEN